MCKKCRTLVRLTAPDSIPGAARTSVDKTKWSSWSALALAIGLAFWLGGKETAGKMVGEWYSKGIQAAPKVAAANDAAKLQASR